MASGAVLPPIMWATMDSRMVGFLCGVAVILFFGLWDDIKGIDYPLKFLGQIIAVLIVVLYGGVAVRYVTFWGLDAVQGYVAVTMTVCELVSVTNSLNLNACSYGLPRLLPQHSPRTSDITAL